MIRTQIQLTEKQARKLRAMAREQGVSLSEMIRRCIEQSLAGPSPGRAEQYVRAAELIGRFIDPKGATDLSAGHDRYLDEALR